MEDVLAACRAALARPGHVVALTGAGVSAESGIPTFRGKEGYWTIGSREYHPQDLATHHAFSRMPWEVWAWYLYRLGVCRRAEPNAGHLAITRLATALPDRFALVTQNVDGLHRRAGTPPAQMFTIHGDISQMRCSADCSLDRFPIPAGVPTIARGETVSDAARALLVCPRCGAMARPHVLWFDESYDEPRFHLETVRRLAARAALLVVVGTSAQTNLPWQVVTLAARAGAAIVDVNPEDNPFGEFASAGLLRAPSATVLPALVDGILAEAR